jgi:RNA polymerase sigma factor (sigma-70 family)
MQDVGDVAGRKAQVPEAEPQPEADVGPEPLDAAYRRLRPALVRLAYLMTGSEAAAEDVVHDAVVAASRHWATIDDPDPYLRRAVVNRSRSAHRTSGREQAKVTRLAGLAAAPAREPAVDETWALLRRLPDRQRQALVLRFYEDLPDAEIARLLGCRPATVRSLVHRGLAAVREVLR